MEDRLKLLYGNTANELAPGIFSIKDGDKLKITNGIKNMVLYRLDIKAEYEIEDHVYLKITQKSTNTTFEMILDKQLRYICDVDSQNIWIYDRNLFFTAIGGDIVIMRNDITVIKEIRKEFIYQ